MFNDTPADSYVYVLIGYFQEILTIPVFVHKYTWCSKNASTLPLNHNNLSIQSQQNTIIKIIALLSKVINNQKIMKKGKGKKCRWPALMLKEFQYTNNTQMNIECFVVIAGAVLFGASIQKKSCIS